MTLTRKPGRPLDISKRAAILAALSADPGEFLEIGTPPYNVALIAEQIGMDPSNLRKTLLKLEADGIVKREIRKMDIWNAIAHDHQERRCLCFWNAATMEHDKELSQQWHDGAQQRSDSAFGQTFARQETIDCHAQLLVE